MKFTARMYVYVCVREREREKERKGVERGERDSPKEKDGERVYNAKVSASFVFESATIKAKVRHTVCDPGAY